MSYKSVTCYQSYAIALLGTSNSLISAYLLLGAALILVPAILSVKATGSLSTETRTVYLIKHYFIVFLSPRIKPYDLTWTWKTIIIEISTNSAERPNDVNTDDHCKVTLPEMGGDMGVLCQLMYLHCVCGYASHIGIEPEGHMPKDKCRYYDV